MIDVKLSGLHGIAGQQTYRLPDRGIVLVRGTNGSGKSMAFVEALATGLWGDVMRRVTSSPWQPTGGQVSITTADLQVTRRRRGKKTTLDWTSWDDLSPQKYETPTKAQEALEAQIGSFAIWRRTSVFSASDAAHFTLAADAERKRLLEVLLGLERLDRAGVRAAKALTEAERALQQHDVEVAYARGRVASMTDVLRGAEATLAALPVGLDRVAIEAEQTRLAQQGTDLDLYRQSRERVREERARTVAKAEAELRRARAASEAAKNVLERERRREAEAVRLAGPRECPACRRALPLGQAYCPVDLQRFIDDVTQADSGYLAAQAGLLAEEAAVRIELDTIRTQLAETAAAQAALGYRAAELDQALRQQAVRQQAADAAATAQANLDQASAALAAATAAGLALGAERDLSAVVADLLGTRGVRSSILAQQLGGLEALACGWLERLPDADGETLALSLRPYSTRKDGSQADALALVVHRRGLELTYDDCSGGQRRRVDIALLLALAGVVQRSGAAGLDLLVFDEVMDSPLDDQGVEAMMDILDELSAGRPVVVITHSPTAIARLTPRAVASYKVENGIISSCR